jgi:hypothetical protein
VLQVGGGLVGLQLARTGGGRHADKDQRAEQKAPVRRRARQEGPTHGCRRSPGLPSGAQVYR